jgi:hypothetical protein
MGTVFALNTNGTGFRILHSFTAPTITNTDGVGPGGGLVISGNGNVLYGAASGGGGTGDSGTAFSLSFPPQLAMTTAGLNLRLSWPTNFTGFALQSTTNLASPVWTTNSAPPVVVNGQNTVTNSISGTHQFFRLSR